MLYLTIVGTRLLDSLRSRNFWRLILIIYGVWTLFGVNSATEEMNEIRP